MDTKYPDITVNLIGQDGNAFAILGRTTTALIRAGVDTDEIQEFSNEATSGDYNHLLRTVMAWVDVN
ncbi:MAG TPA: hypothetical protein VK039_03395 [Brevibacterium sp.]|nr:hypothetical protein [Brevibacterium sp.]